MVNKRKNLAEESTTPYTGPPKKCKGTLPATDFYAAEWGPVDPLNIRETSMQKLKEAICKYGSICTSVYIDQKFMLYVGGPYFGFKSNSYPPLSCAGRISVVIIGWDDSIKCFLIKKLLGH